MVAVRHPGESIVEMVAGRHKNFYIAVTLGLLVGIATAFFISDLALASAVNIFFLTYLVLTGRTSRKLTAQFLREHAAEEDAPAPFILLVMLAAVAASAVSLFLLLQRAQTLHTLQLGLGVASVLLGWFAVHTMWAMHYAFEYYKTPDEERGKKKSGKVQAGLDFPGKEEPSGVSFFYFSYVIGMTAQTSDTAVTSNAMRRLVLVHGVFSFFFNTVIVAAAVNIIVAFAH
jgi:uncharacterized membrane protein